MSDLQIVAVNAPREWRQLIQFPWKLYRDDPNWVPPLRRNQEELLGYRSHPFYERNEIQNFLALRDGEAVGRVAAIVDRGHAEKYEDNVGFFGFFDCIDDQAVADALFARVREWLEERGFSIVRGPVNPSMNYECGLLIDGFDSPPTFMMTYNPPYYGKLLENVGFGKAQDLYEFYGHKDMLEQLDSKLDFIFEECKRRFKLEMRQMSRWNFSRDVNTFLQIYNKSMVGNWGFVPMSEAEVVHMSKSLKHLIVPQMTSVAEVDGKPVGAVFGLLDYNPRIKAIDGKLFPFGFLRLLWNRKGLKKVRLVATNVLPEYQRWGVGLVLLGQMVPGALAHGVEHAEFSWVLESNHLSYKSLKRGGAILTKTFRIYDWPPSDAAND